MLACFSVKLEVPLLSSVDQHKQQYALPVLKKHVADEEWPDKQGSQVGSQIGHISLCQLVAAVALRMCCPTTLVSFSSQSACCLGGSHCMVLATSCSPRVLVIVIALMQQLLQEAGFSLVKLSRRLRKLAMLDAACNAEASKEHVCTKGPFCT